MALKRGAGSEWNNRHFMRGTDFYDLYDVFFVLRENYTVG